MSNGITYEDGNIKIDMDYLIASMNKNDLKRFVKAVALDSFMIDKVIDYICDEDDEGFWAGNSNIRRENILKRIEKTQLSKSVEYNWGFLTEIELRLKILVINKSLYYKIYHSEYLTEAQKSSLLDGEDCEYKTKLADEQIAAIHAMFEEFLIGLRGEKD